MDYRIIENTNDKHLQEVKDILKASDEVFVVRANYKQHKSCRCLYCFVYDPNGFIRNPRGIENVALDKVMPVKVFVRPVY